jgi:hypothetical protein
MEKNVELEFINKVRELSEKMQDLAIFWMLNEKKLEGINDCKFSESLDDLTVSPEDTNFSKNYPTCETFDKLTLNIYSWLLTLINNYCEKDPIVFFDAYYKSLQK